MNRFPESLIALKDKILYEPGIDLFQVIEFLTDASECPEEFFKPMDFLNSSLLTFQSMEILELI